MIHLHDKATGAPLGTITEEQLAFLIDELEEESPEDTDYYLDRPTLEFLEAEGAGPELLAILRHALGQRDEMEIRWSRG